MKPTQNPNTALNISPHYSDEHFRHAQTVYGCKEENLSYKNTDNLWKMNYLKAKASAEVADASGAKQNTANWYQIYLSFYFDQELEVKHILSGWNWNTGFPYIIFGYNEIVK